MGMAIRFNDEWLSEPTFAEWLVKVSNDESRAYCRYCAIVLRAHKSDLTCHATTGKHVKNVSNAANAPSGPISVQIIVDDNQTSTPPPTESTAYSSFYQGPSGSPGQSRLTQRIQYPKKYRVEWEQNDEFKDWLGPDPTDISRATCKMCGVQLRAHKHDLLLHSKSSKHKKCQEEFAEGNFIFGDPMQSADGVTEDTEIMEANDQDVQRKEGEGGTEGSELEGQSGEETSSATPVKLENPLKRVAGNIVRVTAPGGHRIITPFRKRRRFTVNDVIDSINQNHFTGYELLQICKAAIPKL